MLRDRTSDQHLRKGGNTILGILQKFAAPCRWCLEDGPAIPDGPNISAGIAPVSCFPEVMLNVAPTECLSLLVNVFTHTNEIIRMARSIYDRKVADIMTRDVVTLDAGGTVHEALTLMGENRVSALPVVDSQGHCVGILSTTDLVDLTRDVDDDLYQLDLIDATSRRFLIDKLAHSLGNEKFDTFMSETLTTVSPSSTIATATRRILQAGVHHLPVIDEQQQLVGIVSSLDILGEFADAAPE